MKVHPFGSCSSITAPPGAGWYSSIGRYGCRISTRHRRTAQASGSKGWSKPCEWLGGQTLYQFQKAATGFCAHYWPQLYSGTKATWESNAASYPYTNIRNQYRASNAFSLWMHCTVPANLNTWYYLYSLGIKPSFSIAGAFQTAVHESDYLAPALTGATLNSDMTWSLTLSNGSSMFSYYDYFAMYLSAPSQTLFPIHTPFQVQPVTSDWAFSDVWDDNGDGLATAAMKPYPVGTECLIGLRGFTGNHGALPGPLVAINVEVT